MIIEPIAHFSSPFHSKFGIPRQSGIVNEVKGQIHFTAPYNTPEAIRGLEDFERIWLIWEFSENGSGTSLLVRPPRLGGNEKIGVFASRSPFRPNRLGLSCVKIESIDYTQQGPVINVSGADIMNGTPIYDIKPYVAYSDAYPESHSGFVDDTQWKELHVHFPSTIKSSITNGKYSGLTTSDIEAITHLLAQDPRPQYHNDPGRIYGMEYNGHDIRFSIADETAEIVAIADRSS